MALALVSLPLMKTIRWVLFAFLLTGGQLLGQEAKTNSPLRITAAEATNHIDAQAVVVGKVVEVYTTDKLVRLNLDRPFPRQTFTAVIFASSTNLFPDLDKLKGKAIEVSGKITEYHDKPQIILTSTNQLKVVEITPENKVKER